MEGGRKLATMIKRSITFRVAGEGGGYGMHSAWGQGCQKGEKEIAYSHQSLTYYTQDLYSTGGSFLFLEEQCARRASNPFFASMLRRHLE